ncbi:hypothetical protein D027_0770A, partial [Vibrio parahaemolyticus 861]|jgi:hypothetical protein
MQPK